MVTDNKIASYIKGAFGLEWNPDQESIDNRSTSSLMHIWAREVVAYRLIKIAGIFVKYHELETKDSAKLSNERLVKNTPHGTAVYLKVAIFQNTCIVTWETSLITIWYEERTNRSYKNAKIDLGSDTIFACHVRANYIVTKDLRLEENPRLYAFLQAEADKIAPDLEKLKIKEKEK